MQDGELTLLHKLTRKQKEILEFIIQEIDNKNYPPSVREICSAFNLRSSSTAHSHLVALEKKGFIKRDPAKPRALELLEPARRYSTYNNKYNNNKFKMVPLVGTVTAGLPILAEENIEDYLPLPSQYLVKGELFMLRVQGDSMRDAGILDDDLVIVRQQYNAENGEIVVALIDNEATVKRFYKEDSFVRLVPENKDYEPILTSNVKILGKVVGLFRAL